MSQMFGISLTKENVEKIIIEDYENETLLKVINKVREINKERHVLALFIEDYDEDEGNSKPYYFMKYNFVHSDI